jgi:hypothetical protein
MRLSRRPASVRGLDQRHRLAVDDGDLEGERIDALDAAEIDAVAVLGVLAVGDVGEDPAGLAEVVAEDLLVPQVARGRAGRGAA